MKIEDLKKLASQAAVESIVFAKGVNTDKQKQNGIDALLLYNDFLSEYLSVNKIDEQSLEGKAFIEKFNSYLTESIKSIKEAVNVEINNNELKETVEYFFDVKFNQELLKDKDFVELYFERCFERCILLQQIQAAVDYYQRYSIDHCKYSLFHRHGERGRKGADAFYLEISKLTTVEEIKAKVADFLQNGEGNTHPHSFKTVLLASFETGVNIIVTAKIEKPSDSLHELLREISKNFTNFLNAIFPHTRKWAEIIPGKPAGPII